MGEVYLAQDTSELGRTVALKVLPSEVARDKDRLHRFKQEARTVSNLNHPNIITVYEFGQTDSVCFMAPEYIDGVTLRERLSNRRLKLRDVLDMTIEVVAALNAAHEAGVTHRDLKPENVMVRHDHIVKVLDCGRAKLSGPPSMDASKEGNSSEDAATKVLVHTQPGMVMGTVNYRRDKAEETINRFKELAKTRYIAHCRIGCIYGALGDKDKAFAEFEKAFEDRDWDLYRIRIHYSRPCETTGDSRSC